MLKKRIKRRVRELVKGSYTGSIEMLLGFSLLQLRVHIEKQFTPGMSWDLLLKGEIHIDHIIPVRCFSFTSVTDPDFKACWALTNLRPLWAVDNHRKQGKVLTLL